MYFGFSISRHPPLPFVRSFYMLLAATRDPTKVTLLSCLISSKISLMGTNDLSVPSQSAFKQCDPKAVNYITSMLGYFSTIFQCGSGTASKDCLHFKTFFFLSGSWGSLNVREPLIIQGIHLHVALSIN